MLGGARHGVPGHAVHSEEPLTAPLPCAHSECCLGRSDFLNHHGQPDTSAAADSRFYNEDQPCTVMQPYNSNYGWVSEDFKYKVVNLDGTVGHGSRKKDGLRLSGDELCVGNTLQLLPKLIVKVRRLRV